jgi:sugar lactone lactonase YvrE
MTRLRLTAVVGALALVAAAAALANPFPDVIALPNGWQPEGIEAGRGHTLYVGSLKAGAVRQIDARTGKSFTLVPPRPGRSATGIEYDRTYERLFVAGGATGKLYIYSAKTGAPFIAYPLSAAPTFVNDAVLTKDALYLTDSMRPQLYRVALHEQGRPTQSELRTLPLSGDYVHQPGFNLNGIVATKDGNTLIAVQTNTASLFAIDAATGVAKKIALTGGDAANGDGLLLEGRTLYVVQNQSNRVEVVTLAADLRSGTVVRYLTHPAFDVPTTIDRSGDRLYLPNARFTVPNPDTAAYQVVALAKR